MDKESYQKTLGCVLWASIGDAKKMEIIEKKRGFQKSNLQNLRIICYNAPK